MNITSITIPRKQWINEKLYSFEKKYEMTSLYYSGVKFAADGLIHNVGTLNYELMFIDVLLKEARLKELTNKK